MPMWSNDDGLNDKPYFPVERQVRPAINANTGLSIQLTVAQTVIASGNGNSAITFVGANSAVLAGVTAGMYVYDTSLYNTVSYMGDDPGTSNHIDFYTSNNTVLSVSGNVVTLSANVISNVLAGNVIAFGTAVKYKPNVQANTYNQDTILITPTRMANVLVGAANVGNMMPGWVHIQKKVNNDGTVRYLKETLVALASPTASNTSSGNTSFGGFVSGL
jgi:hypothetical protein